MSNDTLEPWNDPEIEVRLVAMALGEASEFERAELERVIEKDAGLKRFYNEMCELHGSIHQAVLEDDDPEWKLSSERSRALHAAFGEEIEKTNEPVVIAPIERSTAREQWRSFAGVAACFLFTLFSIVLVFYRKSVETKSAAEIVSYGIPSEQDTDGFSDYEEQLEEESQLNSRDTGYLGRTDEVSISGSVYSKSANVSSGQYEPLKEGIEIVGGSSFQVEVDDSFSDGSLAMNGNEELDSIGTRAFGFGNKPASSKSNVAKVISALSSAPTAQPTPNQELATLSTGDFDNISRTSGQSLGVNVGQKITKREKKKVNRSRRSQIFVEGQIGSLSKSASSADILDLKEDQSGIAEAFKRDTHSKSFRPLKRESRKGSKDVRQNLYLAEGNINLGKYDDAEAAYKEVLREDRYNIAARRGMERINNAKSDYYRAAYDNTRSELLEQVDEAWEIAVPPREFKKAKEKIAPPVSDEISATEKTDSTFSLNVNDASYKLAKAALLERGEFPSEESVRTEEFVNAFDYDDPKPTMAQKVACAMNQSVHPFIQQRNLLRLSMSTAAQGRSNPLNVVILLDNSGSMDRVDREASVLKIMEVLSTELGPNDKVTLMSFARQTRLLADRWGGNKVGEFAEIIRNRPSEGGTNLEQAIQVAQQHLLDRKKDGMQSRIMLLTDGAANLGDADPESLTKMVEQMRDREIAFDACGIGAEGLDDGILEALTRKGDGRYYVVNKAEDANEDFAKQIAGALRPAAKNVKVQVIFNPDRVGNYKLLGFEKHRLKKEDFRNDSVDAAEMAAEESGSALYQIEAKPEGKGEVGTVFVRFLDTDTGQMVERNWTIPYLPQAPSLENAAPQMQLAAVAGMLGEKLHRSDKGTADFTRINAVIGKLRAAYPNDTKVQELLQMVGKVKN